MTQIYNNDLLFFSTASKPKIDKVMHVQTTGVTDRIIIKHAVVLLKNATVLNVFRKGFYFNFNYALQVVA